MIETPPDSSIIHSGPRISTSTGEQRFPATSPFLRLLSGSLRESSSHLRDEPLAAVAREKFGEHLIIRAPATRFQVRRNSRRSAFN